MVAFVGIVTYPYLPSVGVPSRFAVVFIDPDDMISHSTTILLHDFFINFFVEKFKPSNAANNRCVKTTNNQNQPWAKKCLAFSVRLIGLLVGRTGETYP